MITFVRKENIPKVTIFKGRAKRFNIGFRRAKRSVSATPPKIYVKIPSVTFTPLKTCERKKIENPLNKQFLKNDFIGTIYANKSTFPSQLNS